MKIKKYFKKLKTRVKESPTVKEVRRVTIGGYEQAAADSKKLFNKNRMGKKDYKKSVSYGIKKAVWGNKKPATTKFKVI